MKNILFLIPALLLFWACGQQTESHGDDHDHSAMAADVEIVFPADSANADSTISWHGMRIDEGGAMSIEEMVAIVNEKGGAEGIKVSSSINAVCQAKGCWMTLPLENGEEMRVSFKNYGFFVPKDAAEKVAIMEGNAFVDTVSVEDQIHYAVDGGMEEAEARAKYTEPEIKVSFEATGVMIKDEAKL